MKINFQLSLVTVIIPSYNSEASIDETLQSIIDQTYTHWECLVVDDGSIDETKSIVTKIAAKDERVKYFDRPQESPKGANACRNFGSKKAKGQFILFMDADDLLSSTALEKRAAVLSKDHETDLVVFSTEEFYNTPGDSKNISNRDLEDENRLNYLRSFLSAKFNWTIMSGLWRRSCLHTNPFDENLQRFQDVDLHISQLLRDDLKVKRIKEVDNYYRNPSTPKADDDAFRSKVGNSFIHIFQKTLPKIREDKELVHAFKRFVYVVYLRYIIPNRKSDNELYNQFKKEVLGNAIISNKERRLFKTQAFISSNNLIKYKGLGAYRMESRIKKYFNY
jgi:glycosyltransferase involved in cell wall biosynthesis